MKFRFSLDTVLRVRRHEENRQQKVHAESMRAVLNIQSEIEARADSLRALAESPIPEAFTTGTLERRYAFLHDLHKQRFDLEKELRTAETEAEKQRVKLVGAHQKTRILENLSHKKRLEFQLEESRIELKELNETATIQYNRKRR